MEGWPDCLVELFTKKICKGGHPKPHTGLQRMSVSVAMATEIHSWEQGSPSYLAPAEDALGPTMLVQHARHTVGQHLQHWHCKARVGTASPTSRTEQTTQSDRRKQGPPDAMAQRLVSKRQAMPRNTGQVGRNFHCAELCSALGITRIPEKKVHHADAGRNSSQGLF